MDVPSPVGTAHVSREGAFRALRLAASRKPSPDWKWTRTERSAMVISRPARVSQNPANRRRNGPPGALAAAPLHRGPQCPWCVPVCVSIDATVKTQKQPPVLPLLRLVEERPRRKPKGDTIPRPPPEIPSPFRGAPCPRSLSLKCRSPRSHAGEMPRLGFVSGHGFIQPCRRATRRLGAAAPEHRRRCSPRFI